MPSTRARPRSVHAAEARSASHSAFSDSRSCFSPRCWARENVCPSGVLAARKPGCAAISGSALLSLPIILFHGGFHFGGTLTRVLMWLLIITVVSGLFGAALQHYIPRVMTADVPFETIYDEIGHVRKLLLEEADRSMEALCGSLGLRKASQEEIQRAGGFTAMRPMAAASGGGAAVAAAAEILLLSEEESAPLRRFYLNEMRPFLEHPAERRLLLWPMPIERSGIRRSSHAIAGTRSRNRRRFAETSATKRANSRNSSACTTGCISGSWCTSRFRWL